MIDIRIPWNNDGNLGVAYNMAMAESNYNWLLFLDNDVLVFHPEYPVVCQRVIERYPDAGVFVCRASSTGCAQLKPEKPIGTDLSVDEHEKYAKELWDKHGTHCTRLELEATYPPWHPSIPSGHFMLIKFDTWIEVDGFDSKGMGVDQPFFSRCWERDIPIYRIDGLYCLHLRRRPRQSWLGETT